MDIRINSNNIILTTTSKSYSLHCHHDYSKISIQINTSIEDPLLFLVTLEKLLQEKGFLELELIVPKNNLNILNFLIHSTYSIKSGDFEKVIFSKPIVQEKRIRLSLTENCNYHCFFCHEEGMNMEASRGQTSEEEMCKLLMELKKKNYNTITFTGGEPLLQKKALYKYLDFIESNDYLPSVSIVTNGYLIDDELISRVKQYPGKFKFNISIHAIESEPYFNIVNPKNKDSNAFNTVCSNLRKLHIENIKFKLNFVLLKDINTDLDYIKKILEFTHSIGASEVKFLELLITEKLYNHFDKVFTLDSLKKSLENEIVLVNSTYRRDEYTYTRNGVKIEFQKCTCANGCSNCPLDRAVNITPQMDYYPCFSITSNKIHVTADNLENSLKRGEKVIESFIKKYGSKSPVLIKTGKIVLNKTEYVYTTTKKVSQLEQIIVNHNFRLDRKRLFKDFYYLNKNSDCFNFEKIIKLTHNSYEGFYKEIVSSRTFNVEESSVFTQYLTKGKIIESKEDYDNLMYHLGFSNNITFEWSNLMFIKKESSLSICENLDTHTIFIVSQDPLSLSIQKELSAMPVNQDFCIIIHKKLTS